MLHKAYIMAGLDARHSEERHLLTGTVKRAVPWPLRNGHLHWAVGHPLPVTVDLNIHPEVSYVRSVQKHFISHYA